MEGDQSLSQNDSQSSATEDHHRIKSESLPGDSLFLTTQTLTLAPRPSATAGATSSASPQPIIPSTETNNTNGTAEESPAPANMPGATTKKKGTAAPAKKVPKRARNGKTSSKKAAKKIKPEPTSSRATPAGSAVEEEDEGSEGSEDDESDNGPYCICRGPDDHRWMICCEKCEDWFHGECIKLDKTIGESLIEKFICPNCTDETHTTLYQKTCALGGCRKPSRLLEKGGAATLTNRSVFCSNEHAGAWWERIVARLPKGKMKAGLSDQLTQDEFMALLNHGLIGMNDEGVFRLADTPFKGPIPNGTNSGEDSDLLEILTTEERSFLDEAASRRAQIDQETILCHQMLKLIELAQDRQRSRSTKEDCCGYDSRLDAIYSRDAFAAFVQSEEGQAIFAADELGEPVEPEAINGAPGLSMCERKRCKTHQGWQKILVTGVKQQIKEMAAHAAELTQEENIVREAARERHMRKKAESNWVEVLDG